MSSSVPGSWPPNWLQGKPRIVKSSPGGGESVWLNQRRRVVGSTRVSREDGASVNGERQHTMLFLDLLVQLLQSLILRRETTFRGCVDDEHDLAFVFLERDSLSFLYSQCIVSM